MLRCADLFCSAGGAGMGLHRAGFDVEGWDIVPQPRYPFVFHHGNALDADLAGFDFVWASPPCQCYTRMNRGLLESQGKKKNHPDLIAPVRAKLKAWGGPYIIENVPGAPLMDPVLLCGSMFGLNVQRHRLFESNVFILERECNHGIWSFDKPPLHRLQGKSRVVGCYGNGRGKGDTVAAWAQAMGIDWMIRREIAQAIPPAYSEYLGKQVIAAIRSGEGVAAGAL